MKKIASKNTKSGWIGCSSNVLFLIDIKISTQIYNWINAKKRCRQFQWINHSKFSKHCNPYFPCVIISFALVCYAHSTRCYARVEICQKSNSLRRQIFVFVSFIHTKVTSLSCNIFHRILLLNTIIMCYVNAFISFDQRLQE